MNTIYCLCHRTPDPDIKNYPPIEKLETIDVADGRHSTMTLKTPHNNYTIGSYLTVLITLKSRKGNTIGRGGDEVQVWATGSEISNNVAGDVTDNNNGTYTGMLLLPWAGKFKSIDYHAPLYIIIRLGFNVALTHQNRSYRDRETKGNVEAQKRKQRGGNYRKRTATTPLYSKLYFK